MMRRVSSRPRLVSDADKAFQNAAIEREDDSFSEEEEEVDVRHQGLPQGKGKDKDNDHSDALSDYESCYCREDSMVNLQNSFAEKASLDSIMDYYQLHTAAAAAGCDEIDEEMMKDDLFFSAHHVISPSDDGEDDDDSNGKEASAHLHSNNSKPSSSSKLLQFHSSCNSNIHNIISSAKRKRFTKTYHDKYKLKCASSSSSSSAIPCSMLKSPPAATAATSTTKLSPAEIIATSSKTTLPLPLPPPPPPLLPLTNLPEETILHISSHLTLAEIRILSSTCTSLRRNILLYKGAMEGIWMETLRGSFPNVFLLDEDEENKKMKKKNQQPSVVGGRSVEDGRRMEVGNGDGGVKETNEWKGTDDGMTRRSMDSLNITFVDDLHLSMAGLSTFYNDHADNDDDDDDDAKITNTKEGNQSNTRQVNLPLLTGLLPPRYPQYIDPKTLNVNVHDDDDDGGGGTSHCFRSFCMSIPVAENIAVATAASTVGEEDNVPTTTTATTTTITTTATAAAAIQPQSTTVTKEAPSSKKVMIIPVIQYMGQVGTGDRCIRSDKPFPPTCKEFRLSSKQCCDASSTGSTTTFRSLSSSLLGGERSSGKKKKKKKKKAGKASRGASRAMNSEEVHDNSAIDNANNGAGQAISFATPPSLAESNTLSTPPPPQHHRNHQHHDEEQGLPFANQQHSPLFRFLSSLSHHCDSVSETSSAGEDMEDSDDDNASGHGDHGFDFDNGIHDDNDDDDLGVNNYGMIKNKFYQCKERFDTLRHSGSRKHRARSLNLRPFVIPTVLLPRMKNQDEDKLVVDLTPRFVAYFEVTILEQTPETSVPRVEQRIRRRAPPPRAPPPRAPPPQEQRWQRQHHFQRQQMPLHEDNPWRLHRIFPPIHLRMPLDFVGDFENGYRRVPRPVLRRHLVQRHECLAIGLSTLSFCPQNKMPGWDEHSYGYHGDDGNIFHGSGESFDEYGPTFGPGDTIGCGLDYISRKIFFVRNGVFLGYAFDEVSKDVLDKGLYPTVGVDTECPVHVNFGDQPFKFNLRSFVRDGCARNGNSDRRR